MAVTTKRYANFIGGQTADSATGESDQILNPATGEAIAEVPRSGAEDVDRAVQAAERAFWGEWGDFTPAERAERLFKIADVLEEHAEGDGGRGGGGRRRPLPLHGGRGAHAGGPGGRRVRARRDLDDPARADRR